MTPRPPGPACHHDPLSVVGGGPPEISKLTALATVTRQCGPHLIEATIIPAVLFYACLVTAGLEVAYLGAVGWTYAAVSRGAVRHEGIRHEGIRHEGIPPLLWLGAIGITLRTVVALPLGTFLAAKQLSGLAITAGAVFLTISLSLTTARGRDSPRCRPSFRCPRLAEP